MRIAKIYPQPNWILSIAADDGRIGNFDVTPYLQYEAFQELQDANQFKRVFNGGYFIEWDCGADLSTDTIEAQWKIVEEIAPLATP